MRVQILCSALAMTCSAAILQLCQGLQAQQSSVSTPSHSASMLSGRIVKGNDIKGTLFNVMDDQGQPHWVKITNVELDPNDAEQDIYLYTVVVQDPSTSQWQNLCLSDRDGIAKAIPLSGQWDASGNHLNNEKITFACTNGVLAKCVRWGYKPWKTVKDESLRDYHQTCTRMARADYCGNGIAHTQDGTPIDVYDRLGIQQPESRSNMEFEAAWGPDGAVLLNRTRYSDGLTQLQQECPEKLQTMLHQTDQPLSNREIQQQAPTALIFNRSGN